MAKRKLKRTLKKQRQWAAGSRQKRKAFIEHLAKLRAIIKSSPKKVEVRLIRSVIGCNPSQRATVEALGLGKISSYVVRDYSPSLEGMLKKVLHLIDIKEVN